LLRAASTVLGEKCLHLGLPLIAIVLNYNCDYKNSLKLPLFFNPYVTTPPKLQIPFEYGAF